MHFKGNAALLRSVLFFPPASVCYITLGWSTDPILYAFIATQVY